MRESRRRRFDWIYEGKRRRALREMYSGDPSDPDTIACIMHRVVHGSPQPPIPLRQYWVLQRQYWVRSVQHHWRRFLRK
jgi:hypothetical protein